MIAHRLDYGTGAFLDRQVFDEGVVLELAREDPIDRAVHPCSFLLDVVDILELLHVLVAVVLRLHELVDLFPELSFYCWVHGDIVDDHQEEVGSSVGARNEEGAELFKDLVLVIAILIASTGEVATHHESLDQIFRFALLLPHLLFGFLDSLRNDS